jgi:hypothetical protein
LKILGSSLILKDRNLIIKRAYPYELVAKISPSVDWLGLIGSTELADVSSRRQALALRPGVEGFTPAAESHGLWPWMNAPTFGRDVAPLGR